MLFGIGDFAIRGDEAKDEDAGGQLGVESEVIDVIIDHLDELRIGSTVAEMIEMLGADFVAGGFAVEVVFFLAEGAVRGDADFDEGDDEGVDVVFAVVLKLFNE